MNQKGNYIGIEVDYIELKRKDKDGLFWVYWHWNLNEDISAATHFAKAEDAETLAALVAERVEGKPGMSAFDELDIKDLEVMVHSCIESKSKSYSSILYD